MNQLPRAKRARILAMLIEGASMRSVARTAGVSINTVAKLLHDAGRAAKIFHDSRVRGIRGRRRVECSRVWAFGDTGQPPEQDPERPLRTRDAWTYTAIDAKSRLIVSYSISFRAVGAAIALKDALRTRFRVKPVLVTNPLPTNVTGTVESTRADFAGAFHRARADAAARADPKSKADRSTGRMETYRAVVSLYALHHNYCRIQRSGTTPAMAAGLEDEIRDTAWIVELIDARAPKPKRPSTYRKLVRSGVH
ncbi:MAG: hypothetical protein J4F45_09465 [Pseudomonadales bacterium]|nr:hypothetical protein [Pseudomonadales bacterium]